jgi:hypothetical protein
MIVDNALDQHFDVTVPDRIWVKDITYIPGAWPKQGASARSSASATVTPTP